MSDEYFDELETRSPSARHAWQLARLTQQIAYAKECSPHYAALLSDIDPRQIDNLAALATIPVTRKHELAQLQQNAKAQGRPPFADFASQHYGVKMPRVFASPGPIYEPEGGGRDYWRMGRAVHAAGFRAGELVHNSLSYHMTPGGLMLESGAHAVGCTVFPAGVGQTEQQLSAMAELRPTGYMGTPSFLKILVEKAHETKTDISSLKKALMGGEAFPPSLYEWFLERGIVGYQCLATADVGLIAYETRAREGMVVDEEVLLEVVHPGTNEPVAQGEIGELVVTMLSNRLYPLIRFGTGDMTAVATPACPTGRTNQRIKGWLGRADQTTKMRGMFVHPAQVHDIVRRFAEIERARLVVSGEMAQDHIVLKVELRTHPEGLVGRIAQSAREVTRLRVTVEPVALNTLPQDGRVIEDARSYR